MTEPSILPTCATAVGDVDQAERGEGPECFAHHGAADAELVSEKAFAWKIVADPKPGIAYVRFDGIDGLRDERFAVVGCDSWPSGGRQPGAEVARRNTEAPAEGAAEARIVVIAAAVADQAHGQIGRKKLRRASARRRSSSASVTVQL